MSSITEEDIDAMKVTELKSALKERRLSLSGKKAEMQERLKQWLEENSGKDENDVNDNEKQGEKNDQAEDVTEKSLLESEKTSHANSVNEGEATLNPDLSKAEQAPAITPSETRTLEIQAETSEPAHRPMETEDVMPAPTALETESSTTVATPVETEAQQSQSITLETQTVPSNVSERTESSKRDSVPMRPSTTENLASLLDDNEDILAEDLAEVQAKDHAPVAPTKKRRILPDKPKTVLEVPRRKPVVSSAVPAAKSEARTKITPTNRHESASVEVNFERVNEPEEAKCPPSATIRIDGLKRPFPVLKLREVLSEHCGKDLVPGVSYFLNSTRTHCFVTLDTIKEATALRLKVSGTKFKDGLLSADFSDITASQANRAAHQELDLRAQAMATMAGKKRVLDRVEAAPARAREPVPEPNAPVTQTDSASTFMPDLRETIMQTMKAPESRRKLKRVDAGANPLFKGAIGSLMRQASSTSIEGDEAQGFTTKRHRTVDPPTVSARETKARRIEREDEPSKRKDDTSIPTRATDRATSTTGKRPTVPPPAPVVSLDTLFRKTKTKPALYWLPVGDEEVARRKKVKEAKKAAGTDKDVQDEDVQGNGDDPANEKDEEEQNGKEDRGAEANSSGELTAEAAVPAD